MLSFTARATNLPAGRLAAVPGIVVDYVSIVDAESLQPIEKIEDESVLIALAARFGTTRLIDNTILNRK